MSVKFKKDFNTKIDISELLSEIHKIKRLPDDGKDKYEYGFSISFKNNKVSFADSVKYDKINSMLLKSILDFKTNISNFSKDQIIKHTLNEVALKNITSPVDFLKEIQNQYKKYYNDKKAGQSFYLLATLSVDKLPFSFIKLNDADLHFYDEFPEIYKKARSEQFKRHYDKLEESKFLKVVVTVKDRDFQDAFIKALTNLEIFRAFLCLQTTTWRFPLTTTPINQILVGDFLTLHNSDGHYCNNDFYWFEPTKKKNKIYNFDKEELKLIGKQTIELVEKLNNCQPKHKQTISNALNQYVNAFDLVNKESCFLKGWAALENLLNTHKNDELVKRCITGYKQTEFLLLEIESLKTYRNEIVHELKVGDNDDSELLSYCFILLKFIRHQISFNLNLSGKVKSIAEYADYVDYYNDKERLKERKEKYKDFLK
jgi:hypothetical protein